MFPDPSNAFGGDLRGGFLQRVAEYPGGNGRKGYRFDIEVGRSVQGGPYSLLATGPGCPDSPGIQALRRVQPRWPVIVPPR